MTTYSKPKPPGTPTWVELITPDIDGARAFYHTVFRWNYDIGGPEYGGYTTARRARRTVAGLSGPQPNAPPMPAAWGLYFATANVEAAAASAVKLGAKVLFPPMVVGEMGSMAICIDPGGASFGFWQSGQHKGSQLTDKPGSTTWYELYAPNAKEARDFYSALLGATADPMPGDMEYYVLYHGKKMLCGIMQIDPAWGDFHPMWSIYFSVANADKTAATVTKHGGTMLGPVDDSPYGRIAALRDPSGAVFKIVQPPAG